MGEPHLMHVGYRSTANQKNELIDIACELGYPCVSELIRHIVEGWIVAFKKCGGAKEDFE